jgi:hypothetical protein
MSGHKIDLGRALKSVGDAYLDENPADLMARREEVRARQGRRVLRLATGVAAVGAAVLAGFFVFTGGTSLEESITPIVPAPSPGSNLEPAVVAELKNLPLKAAASAESVFVIERDSNFITRIAKHDGEVRARRFLGAPAADVVTSTDGGVWVTVPDLNSVFHLHPRRLSNLSPPIVLPGPPVRLHVATVALRVSIRGGGVYMVPLDTREPRSVYEGGVTDLAMGSNALWVLTTDGLIQPLDTQTGAVRSDLQAQEVDPGGEITFAREAIWYGHPQSSELLRIEEATGRVIDRIELPGNYSDLGTSRDGLWVLLTGPYDEAILVELDVNGELGPRRFQAGEGAVDIASDSEGVWLLSANTTKVLYLR